MDIVAFFQQSAGRWSSIKSNHHVATTQQQSGRSTIEMELVEISDPAVTQLCEKQGVNPAQVTCAAKVKWEGTMEGETKAETGSSLLVAVGEPTQGKLLRSLGNFGAPGPTGSYHFGEGGEMVLAVDDRVNDQHVLSIERVWFESENVRMRHVKVQRPDGESVVSFCSEVRLLQAKA
jgi:hypothetical protein